MCECLIYYDDHWMDSIPRNEVNKMDDKERARYEARPERWNIVDVYGDGYFGTEIINAPFAAVKLPGVSTSLMDQYKVAQEEVDEVEFKRKHIKYRKYKIKENQIPQSIIDDLDLSRMTTVTDQNILDNITNFLEDKFE